MKTTALILAACATACLSFQPGRDTLGPFMAATNFTIDQGGTPDTRPGTWGSAASYPIQVPFHPPSGYRTRILRVSGDFTAFPKDGVIAPGEYSEVSWGLLTTAPGGSQRADFIADDCFLWNQGILTAQNAMVRMPFDYDVAAGGLLGPDNILVVQLSVSLNTTGLIIHEEPVFTLQYRFERQ